MREGRQTKALQDEQGTAQDLTIGSIGVRIRAIREVGARSREEVARAAGLAPDDLDAIEQGKKNPSFTELSKIAAGLKVPLPQLFSELTPAAVVAAALFESAPEPIRGAVTTILRQTKGDA